MSTGSRRIDDLESAEVLDDKDEFLFFQNSSKRTKSKCDQLFSALAGKPKGDAHGWI